MDRHSIDGTPPSNGIRSLEKAIARRNIRQVQESNPFATLMDLIRELKEAKIHFELSHHRDDGVSILATLPGERWEIDVLDDGEVDFERFKSDGAIQDRTALNEAIHQFAE